MANITLIKRLLQRYLYSYENAILNVLYHCSEYFLCMEKFILLYTGSFEICNLIVMYNIVKLYIMSLYINSYFLQKSNYVTIFLDEVLIKTIGLAQKIRKYIKISEKRWWEVWGSIIHKHTIAATKSRFKKYRMFKTTAARV